MAAKKENSRIVTFRSRTHSVDVEPDDPLELIWRFCPPKSVPVTFTFEFPKVKAAILYFAKSGLPEFTKGKLCKLLFLSDKLHLVRYGRPITGDSYAAMEHGPIPSRVLDILDAIERETTLNDEAVELAAALSLDRRFRYPRLSAVERPRLKNLSESDIEVLNEIIREHGMRSFTQLRHLTHDMPAYEKVWEDPSRIGGSVPMRFEDFFEEDEAALAGVLEEMIENCKLHEAFPDPAWL
jgi:uncharacterized phage-associated protein